MSHFGHQERFVAMLIKALADMGGMYTVDDILNEINAGSMQSFTIENSWGITKVLDFPRKRVLQLFLVVGEGKDLEALEHKIEDYAVTVKADFIQAYGRPGWHRMAERSGWRNTRAVFVKEMK